MTRHSFASAASIALNSFALILILLEISRSPSSTGRDCHAGLLGE
jgi:hypothetical protein